MKKLYVVRRESLSRAGDGNVAVLRTKSAAEKYRKAQEEGIDPQYCCYQVSEVEDLTKQ